MAINPNTDFTVGQVATASQMNRFPRGIMQIATTTADDTFTIEEVQLTATFTAVANRYYKITYYEPYLYTTAVTTEAAIRIRQTNITGTILQLNYIYANSTQGNSATSMAVKTFSAGSQTVVATLQCPGGTGNADRSASSVAILVVEDIGPA